jgi:hypothetical protein
MYYTTQVHIVSYICVLNTKHVAATCLTFIGKGKVDPKTGHENPERE